MNSAASDTKQQEVRDVLVRFINRRSLDAQGSLEERRSEDRTPLSVPVWIIPFSNGQPEIDKSFRGLTKDFSSSGVGLLVDETALTDVVLLALSTEPDPTFLLAKTRSCTALGEGYFLLGTAVTDVVSPSEFPELLLLAPGPTR